ncbi:MAG: cytochrome b/b6 domain-containing protein [Cyanobacteria bacterium REEB65]|nr:cytochrome b/b6 domain-containing protein [Cyanobacteria bacterium REEB65]
MQSSIPVADQDLKRFTLAERSLHWAIASAVLFNLTTGLFIWRSWDDFFKIGHLNPISQAHFWLGGGTIIVSGFVFVALRRDRIAQADKRMNAQQLFNLSAIQLLLCMQAATGVVMKFWRHWGVPKAFLFLIARVHLFTAATVLTLILVHLFMVLVYPKNRGVVWGMVRGRVNRDIARRVWPSWVNSLGDDK